ncbi:MAG: hypothetical protein Q8M08_13425 [Bacteroidales bacterium]|nr:hypothetical protein [Bacteroidales bacterium]
MMISLQKFESQIDEIIVDRGLSYWENGNVIELEQTAIGEFEALVSGNEDYEVKIKVEGDNIQDFDCNCPYDKGPVCKHVVAVLFAIQNGKTNGLKKTKPNKARKGKISEKQLLENPFENILTRLDKNEMTGWIRTWAEKDEKFRNYFIARFNENKEKIDIERYARILEKEISTAEDRYGYIDYYHAGDAADEASQLLGNTESSFKIIGTAEIFSVCFAVIKTVAPAINNSDDSNGEIGGAIEHAVELIVRTFEEKDLSDSMKKELFELCLKYQNTEGMDINNWDLDLLDIAGELVYCQQEKERLFLLLDRKDTTASWHHTNELTAQIRQKVIGCLEGSAAADSYIKSMLHLPGIRKQFVEKYIREKNYSAAKELCNKGIILDEKWPGIVGDWNKFLLTIAEKEGDITEILRTATLLFLGKFNAKEFYPILKKYTSSDKWNQTVEFLIRELDKKNGDEYITWIYIQEGMFENLLSFIQENPHPFNIEKFEQYLTPIYPDAIKDLYEKAILRYAAHASNRKAYAECCRLLRKMKKLGDKHRVDLLINDLTTTYKSRPAFLDELKRV